MRWYRTYRTVTRYEMLLSWYFLTDECLPMCARINEAFTQSSIANANRMNCETHPWSFHRFYIKKNCSKYTQYISIYFLFSFTLLLPDILFCCSSVGNLHVQSLFYSRCATRQQPSHDSCIYSHRLCMHHIAPLFCI